MWLSPLYLTFLLELCLLGLAKFPWRPFVLDLFGDFIPKRENVGLMEASVSKLGRGKLCANIGRQDQKGGSLI
jgi:hypothetical protein